MLSQDHRSSSEPGAWWTLGLCGRSQRRSTCASPERCPDGFQRRVNSPVPMERRLPTVTRAPPVCRSVGFTHTRRSERPVPQCEVPDADPQNLTASPSKSAPIVGALERRACVFDHECFVSRGKPRRLFCLSGTARPCRMHRTPSVVSEGSAAHSVELRLSLCRSADRIAAVGALARLSRHRADCARSTRSSASPSGSMPRAPSSASRGARCPPRCGQLGIALRVPWSGVAVCGRNRWSL